MDDKKATHWMNILDSGQAKMLGTNGVLAEMITDISNNGITANALFVGTLLQSLRNALTKELTRRILRMDTLERVALQYFQLVQAMCHPTIIDYERQHAAIVNYALLMAFVVNTHHTNNRATLKHVMEACGYPQDINRLIDMHVRPMLHIQCSHHIRDWIIDNITVCCSQQVALKHQALDNQ